MILLSEGNIVTRSKRKLHIPKDISWYRGANKVIKDKIKFYESKGNIRKTAIYKAKLKQNISVIAKLSSAIKK